jgi:ABC-type multidrug transport system fused ATPase/permease subunit
MMVIQGSATVGVVIAFLQYVQNFFRPIQQVATLWTQAQSAFAAAERVFILLDTTPDIVDKADALTLPVIKGDVTFKNVTFAYDSEQAVLCNINLSVKEGQTVAIVGPTGAGKSTLVSLLARFYDPSQGNVSIDGHDLKDISQHSIRSQMGIVTQEPFLFSGTIMDNIRYGKLDASDDQVQIAAKAANAHGFIEKLPNGYQTEVGERGKLLSQGQRQLIAIARAVLANPRIVILDEATASIDTRTEVLIQKALDGLLKKRTSFVIAHRLSTIRDADLVIVIDDGEIVESGTHESLLNQHGLYADLHQKQYYANPATLN